MPSPLHRAPGSLRSSPLSLDGGGVGSSPQSEPGLHDRVRGSDGVAGGFGVVAAPGPGGPAEGAIGELVDLPPGLLLEPVIMPALRTPVAQTGPAARLVRDVVFEIALAGGPSADRASARGVPDLGQVPELDPGVVAPGFVPVLAVLGVEGVDRDDQ